MNSIEVHLMENKIGYECISMIDTNQVRLKQELGKEEVFLFDKVFTSKVSQEEMYNVAGKDSLNDVINGYNTTIFTYGQSSSGKTFTMYGDNLYDDIDKGIVPRTM